MFGSKNLKRARVAVLAADGYEKAELTAPADALRERGARVEIVSLHPGSIRGVNLHEPAGRIRVDRSLADADAGAYDALLIPGGLVNPDLLRQSAEARAFVRAFDTAGKPVASLCHGPAVLASAGLARGRMLTSWPGLREEFVQAGAAWRDEAVVRDRNWVTGRSPEDMNAFIRAMCDLFAEAGSAAAGGLRLQPAAPVQKAQRVLRSLPRPSAKTLLGLAVIGAGIAVATRRRHSVAG